jgi:hypothetical protein
VQWSALSGTQTGNSPITSYNLYWDNGSGTVNIQLIDSLTTSYIVYGVTPGSNYNFQVRAKNIYGYSAFSISGVIKASTVPALMSTVTTSIAATQTVDI